MQEDCGIEEWCLENLVSSSLSKDEGSMSVNRPLCHTMWQLKRVSVRRDSGQRAAARRVKALASVSSVCRLEFQDGKPDRPEPRPSRAAALSAMQNGVCV
ncbi:MAG: hypothetical protein H6Q05_3907 [Acidobacteria bacterium]|nr:hypothetical protein [Acidobacteriota bacterium]